MARRIRSITTGTIVRKQCARVRKSDGPGINAQHGTLQNVTGPSTAAWQEFLRTTGISQRPHRVRTWSPRGETPILRYNFNWDTISAAAGITFFNFYFRLYEGTIKSPEVVDFLQALLRHIPGPLLIV